MRPAALALVASVLLLAAAGGGHADAPGDPPPNIVFVLVDDLSWDLLPYMPQVRRMQREGATFTRFFVADSLCCSSRASFLTGQFPHNTHVLGNGPPDGGYSAFVAHGGPARSIGPALQRAAYRTGFLGKYLNHYRPRRDGVPPGWDTWAVAGWGYRGFDYRLNVDGRVEHHGHVPGDYLTDVLRAHAVDFIHRAHGTAPFFLEVAPFAPHEPATPAPRHRALFAGLALPPDRAFGVQNRAAPAWLAGRPPLTPAQIARLTADFRRRVQAIQAVDDLVGAVRRAVDDIGATARTYVLFTSDNGYHLGQHRLLGGKTTVFDEDIRVPLVVVGPEVRAGSRPDALTENVDLAPTFLAMARRSPDGWRDGRSLLGLLAGRTPSGWRDSVLVEHRFTRDGRGDPDLQAWRDGTPPDYAALRTRDATYVEYADGTREYYDHRADPAELDNAVARLGEGEAAALDAALARYRGCAGAGGCERASRVTGTGVRVTRAPLPRPLPPPPSLLR